MSIVLDSEGQFKGRPSLLSRDKPCVGCGEKAIEIIQEIEGKSQTAILDGEPVSVKLTIPVRFKLVDNTF